MMPVEYITIAEIVNTQGNRGAVRLIPYTDFPERFNDLKAVSILLHQERFTYHIVDTRRHKHFIIVDFSEVQNMNDAEKLKGGLLQITKDELRPLAKDNYYIFEIIGLNVVDITGEKLGRVTDVIKTGANDVYIIKPATGAEIALPALKTVVKKVDIENKQMLVELPEGLLD